MKLRETNIEKLSTGVFDVLIIGGGINGAVSAGVHLDGHLAVLGYREFLHQTTTLFDAQNHPIGRTGREY